MRRIVFLTAAVAAAATLATSAQAGHHRSTARLHARWYRLSLTQKRAVVREAIRRERQPLLWWLSHRSRFPATAAGPFVFCSNVGIRTPPAICRTTVPLIQSIHVLQRIEARIAAARPRLDQSLLAAFKCIHGYEGAWNANTGNGYYGGMQEDYGFQKTYGSEFLARWGTADNWPPWAQLLAAQRAHDGYNGFSARGFGPWPNTARFCGLL